MDTPGALWKVVEEYLDPVEQAVEALAQPLDDAGELAADALASVVSDGDTEPLRSAVETRAPNRVDDILLTALTKEETDRHETVVHLRDDLQDLLDSS